MSWTEPVDAYCERLGPEFWSEPINAVTNAAFLVAAVAAAYTARDRMRDDWGVPALIVILTLIGIGSFLFHTYATRWAGLADVLPIVAFIYLYFFLAMRRILMLGVWLAVGATVAFFAASFVVAPAATQLVGSSGGYAPAALAIFGVAAVAKRRRPEFSGPLAVAGVVFLISLGFRTSDILFCPSFPLGTHFVWHCLNAIVLYLLIRVMVRSHPSAPAQ